MRWRLTSRPVHRTTLSRRAVSQVCLILVLSGVSVWEMDSVGASGGTGPSRAAGVALGPGDSWVFGGMLRIESAVISNGRSPQERSLTFFARLKTRVKTFNGAKLELVREVERYPSVAQLWSEKKLAQTDPLSKGSLLQQFPLSGPNKGIGSTDGTFMAPLVNDFFLPLLLPEAFVAGETFQYDIPIRNPMSPDLSPWQAALEVHVAEIRDGSARLDYEYLAPEQSREENGRCVRFQFAATGTMTIDCEKRWITRRKGEQDTEHTFNDRLCRSEKVTFDLRRIP